MPHQYIDSENRLAHDRDDRRHHRQRIFQAWDHLCAYCGSPACTLDHVVPKVSGGTPDTNNLVSCCPRCNQSKGNRSLLDWFPRQRFYTHEKHLRISIWREEPWA